MDIQRHIEAATTQMYGMEIQVMDNMDIMKKIVKQSM